MALGLVALVGIATALVARSGDLPVPGSTEVGDDAVVLPSDEPGGTPPDTGPGEVRCTRTGVTTACLRWDVDTGGPISLGPRLEGAGVLVTTDDEAWWPAGPRPASSGGAGTSCAARDHTGSSTA